MWIEIIYLCLLRSVQANANEPGRKILAQKCCADGEYMLFDDKGVRSCKRLEGVAAANALFERVEDILNRDPAESTDFEWLPHEFRTRESSDLWVKYSQETLCPRKYALFINSTDKHLYRIGEKNSFIFMANTTGGQIVELPFSNHEYCIDKAAGFKSHHVFMICPCERTKCIPKCCPTDRVLRFRGSDLECKYVTDLNWKPFSDLTLEKEIIYAVLDGQFPECSYLLKHKEEMYWTDNYMRSWFISSKGRVFEDKDMCTDLLWHDTAPLSHTIVFCSMTPDVVAIIDRRATLHIIATVILGVSIIGLVSHSLTWTVHLHSLCFHFVSLFFYHALLASTMFPEKPLIPCNIIGFLLYYFTLGSAIWLMIAVFNYALNPRELLNALPEDQIKKCQIALCVFYSIFGLSVPGFFVAFTIFVQGTLDLPQNALRPTLRTTRACSDDTGKITSETFIHFSAPLSLLLILVIVLFTTIAVQMRILRDMAFIIRRHENLPVRSFYVKWRTVIYFALLWLVMVLVFTLELMEWTNEDPTEMIFEILTDFFEITRAGGIFLYWGTRLIWTLLKTLWGLHDRPNSEQTSEDESTERIETAEPQNVSASSSSGQSPAAGEAASTSGLGSASGSASSMSVLQSPFAAIRSGWWKWRFPNPRRRSYSPAGVTVAQLPEAASSTAGRLLPLTPDTPAPARRASQLSLTPSTDSSRLSPSPPRAGPSWLSSSPPRTTSSRLSTSPPRTTPSQLSTSPQQESSQLSTSSPGDASSRLSTSPPSTTRPSQQPPDTPPPTSPSPPSSPTSSSKRASPVRALFDHISPSRAPAGDSSPSSPSTPPPRPSVQLVSMNPAGASEDLIIHEQESSM